jgi:hypothetical protein
MSNLTPLQEAMNRAHSDNGSTCLPNCWRSHYGDLPPSHECNWCDARLPNGDNQAAIAHNEWHMANPESITK